MLKILGLGGVFGVVMKRLDVYGPSPLSLQPVNRNSYVKFILLES
jgi:hypothetical protein|tara:strand:- start:242 stop:376 length:135 start_codon:yes stop_codon:yes gene_type:complete